MCVLSGEALHLASPPVTFPLELVRVGGGGGGGVVGGGGRVEQGLPGPVRRQDGEPEAHQ